MLILSPTNTVFPLLSTKAIVEPMIPLPKPRGFWDYALFASAMAGALLFLFWLEASDGVGWADAALAIATGVLSVLAIVLARKREKAKWIAQPTAYAHLLGVLGGLGLIFGAGYADAYLFHRGDITASRFWSDMALAIVLTVVMLWWSLRRRPPASRPLS
jgi:hypothetical protein